MYIKDLFAKNKTVISFETFPPKQNSSFDSVMEAIEKIAKIKPDYMSVTYGAGGGTSKNTVKIASKIQNNLNVLALAHLTCVSSTKAEIQSILEQLKQNNIHNILALRGDIPKDDSIPTHLDYSHACNLIEDIKKFGGFCVAGACYPECHTECSGIEKDIQNLKLKVETGCDFLISQLFFDNTKMYRFMDKIRSVGISVPVEAGIMPITNSKQIHKMVELSAASIPKDFRDMLDRYKDDASLKEAGIEYALKQIDGLMGYGIDGIHVYTMNKYDVAQKIIDGISFN